MLWVQRLRVLTPHIPGKRNTPEEAAHAGTDHAFERLNADGYAGAERRKCSTLGLLRILVAQRCVPACKAEERAAEHRLLTEQVLMSHAHLRLNSGPDSACILYY